MHAGDERLAWNDAGPCPACGDPDCWLGCDDTDVLDDEVDGDEGPVEVVLHR